MYMHGFLRCWESWWNYRHWPASATEFCEVLLGCRGMILCKFNTVASSFFFFAYNRTRNNKNMTRKKHWIISTWCNDRWTLELHLAHLVSFLDVKKEEEKNTNQHTWEAFFTAGGSVLFTPNGLCEQKVAKVICSESFCSASELKD